MRSLSRAAVAQRPLSLATAPAVSPPNLVRLAQPSAAPGNDDPLETMAREMKRLWKADALLVIWHRGVDRMTLFADEPSFPDALQDMHRYAASAATSAGAANTCFVADNAYGELLIFPVPVEQGIVTITTLFLHGGAASAGPVRKAAADALPFVEPFFRLWAKHIKAELSLRGMTAAVNRVECGIAVIARNGQLLFANNACETMLSEADGIRRLGGGISAASLADTLRLHATIDYVVTTDRGSNSERRAAAPVLAIARQGRRPLLVAVAAEDHDAERAEERTAIAYFFDSGADLQPTLEPVCKLYGLSPVETKLACLLAEGISLAEAATRMHVRELTARSYLKQIFMKTDTNRQAELVCLMLKSSVRIAPACRTTLVQ